MLICTLKKVLVKVRQHSSSVRDGGQNLHSTKTVFCFSTKQIQLFSELLTKCWKQPPPHRYCMWHWLLSTDALVTPIGCHTIKWKSCCSKKHSVVFLNELTNFITHSLHLLLTLSVPALLLWQCGILNNWTVHSNSALNFQTSPLWAKLSSGPLNISKRTLHSVKSSVGPLIHVIHIWIAVSSSTVTYCEKPTWNSPPPVQVPGSHSSLSVGWWCCQLAGRWMTTVSLHGHVS